MRRARFHSGSDGAGSLNRQRLALHGAAILVACLLTAGCSRDVAQPAGSSPRLVSTAPNLTECVCAIGAGDQLAGRTETCDYPPEVVKTVPITGGFGTPYLEPLLAVRPTHVLETVLADPEVRRRLAALKIPVVHVPCTRLGEIPDALRQLGKLTGHDAQAEALATDLETGLRTARAEAEARTDRPHALLLFAPDTPITAGRNAFIAELLELAGALNIGRDETTDYYHVSLEWVLTQDPDLILCLFDTQGHDPLTFFTSQTGRKALRPVREGRVYTVADLNTVSRPGARVLRGLAQFKGLLARDAARHPANLREGAVTP